MIRQLVRRRQRLIVFAGIGALCFGFQYVLLVASVRAGLHPAWACNAGAFLVSAQLNFVLSKKYTWRDRPTDNQRMKRLLSYHIVAVISLVLNTFGFYVVNTATGTLLLSQVAGVALGMSVTYLLCNRRVFKAAADAAAQPQRRLQVVVEGLE